MCICFFSSRRRHTRYWRDWSSDVCSSDLDYALRRAIEKSGRGYVLAVTSRQRLGFKTVADWLEDVPAGTWRRLNAGDGAKGPRLYDWAWLPYGLEAESGWQKGLLVRRKLAQPEAFTFYLTLAPEGTGLSDLVRVAGTRWTIEACFEAAKGEVGLDQYEVRSWTGWHRDRKSVVEGKRGDLGGR